MGKHISVNPEYWYPDVLTMIILGKKPTMNIRVISAAYSLILYDIDPKILFIFSGNAKPANTWNTWNIQNKLRLQFQLAQRILCEQL